MFRGHIWSSRAFPKTAQEDVILAAGVDKKRALYSDDIEEAVKSLRANDTLVVAGLRGIGRKREEIEKNIARIHAKKCAVMDAASGRLSTGKHRAALIEEAVKALANERRGPRKRTKKDRRMPWDQVAKLYFNPLLSNDEVEAAVANGFSAMSYATMRRHFGKPRGAPVGRPSTKRNETVR